MIHTTDTYRGPVWPQSSQLTDPLRDEPKRRPQAKAGTVCVYLIAAGEHVKIGTTTQDPRRRLASPHLPDGAQLVAVIPDAGEVHERALHDMFRRSRTNGKWFLRTPELDALIRTFAI